MMSYRNGLGSGLEEKFALEICRPRNLIQSPFIRGPGLKLDLSLCSKSGQGSSQTPGVEQTISGSEMG